MPQNCRLLPLEVRPIWQIGRPISKGERQFSRKPTVFIKKRLILTQKHRADAWRHENEKSQRDLIIQPGVGRRSRPTLGGRADVKQP